MITPQLLVELGAARSDADSIAEPLKAACALFDISTPQAIAAFLGQCFVETARFSRFDENLNYSTPSILAKTFSKVRALPAEKQKTYLRNPQGLANLVYAGRYGNGDEASGDGWRYRGRGCIQTTFKANYERAKTLTGRPYVAKPELLQEPSDAALSAAAYFASRGCARMAADGLTDSTLLAITRLVNPALLEHHLRATTSLKALTAIFKLK